MSDEPHWKKRLRENRGRKHNPGWHGKWAIKSGEHQFSSFWKPPLAAKAGWGGEETPRGWTRVKTPTLAPVRYGGIVAAMKPDTVLGIDPQISFKDFAGRPVPSIDHGQAIKEIL